MIDIQDKLSLDETSGGTTMEMNEFYLELGQNIRRFRKICNMTQKQLAHSVNKSLACVSKYEKGTVAIDIYTIQQIANQLGVSVGQLIPESKPVSQQPAATSLQLHPMFRYSPLYLCWYRGGKQSLVRHVIEVDSSSGQVSCYMEVDNYSDYIRDLGAEELALIGFDLFAMHDKEYVTSSLKILGDKELLDAIIEKTDNKQERVSILGVVMDKYESLNDIEKKDDMINSFKKDMTAMIKSSSREDLLGMVKPIADAVRELEELGFRL